MMHNSIVGQKWWNAEQSKYENQKGSNQPRKKAGK